MTTIDLTKSYAGTCQACFCIQVCKGHKKLAMVLHGYQRPGYGWIEGQCWGRGELPYELSCELTKTWLAGVQDHLHRIRNYLMDLQDDRVDTLLIQVHVPYEDRKVRHKPEKKTIKIGRDWVSPTTSSWEISRGREDIDNFKNRRLSQIKDAQLTIQSLESDVRFLSKKVADWRYAPEALVEHETYVREQARLSKAEADAVRHGKDVAKAMVNLGKAFRYLGIAINKHRAGHRNANHYGNFAKWDLFEEQVKAFSYRAVFVSVYGERRDVSPTSVEQLTSLSLAAFDQMYPGIKKGKK